MRDDAAPDEHERAGSPEARSDWSWLALVFGLVSAGWAVAILVPGMPPLPAWPAASAGVFALTFARLPGRALPRGGGAFLGFVGLVVGLLEIAALWGLLHLTE